MKRIDVLTDAQKAQMKPWVEKWIAIGLSTEPADFDKATEAALKGYAVCNLNKPMVILRMSSPYAATIGGAVAWRILKDMKFTTVGDQVRDQVRAQGGDQGRAQVRDQVVAQVGDQVWAQVRAQVGDQVRDQVGDQVRDQVGDQVWDQVWAQVGDQVGAQVGAQVWAQVGDQVRAQVWAQVWAQVGDQVPE